MNKSTQYRTGSTSLIRNFKNSSMPQSKTQTINS